METNLVDDLARALITLDQYVAGKATSVISRRIAARFVARKLRQYNITAPNWSAYKKQRRLRDDPRERV